MVVATRDATALARPTTLPEAIEQALVQGNLANLTPTDRVILYNQTCSSLGLNPLTTPFQYITLNGKLVLYATRNCTDQLRKVHSVTISIMSRERIDDIYVVTARATLPNGRADEEIGAVPIAGLKGEALANAMMKAGTKAKRRVTLGVVGLSLLDETEVDTIPNARAANVETIPQHVLTGDIGETPNLDAQLEKARTEESKPSASRPKLEAKFEAGIKAARSLEIDVDDIDTSGLTDQELRDWIMHLSTMVTDVRAEKAKQAETTIEDDSAPF